MFVIFFPSLKEKLVNFFVWGQIFSIFYYLDGLLKTCCQLMLFIFLDYIG